MRTLVATIAAVASLAVTAAPAPAAKGLPPFPKLGGSWTHVDVNRKINGVWHTLSLDRGRIIKVSQVQITLREADGTIQPIPLSPSTLITFRGFGVRSAVLRRGLFAMAMRIDDGPAVRVRVIRRP